MRDRIIARVIADGPMPFDDYMETCLYDPDAGFFGAGRGAPGREQDFLTSPEVSSLFGTLVGRWALGVADAAGFGDDVPLIEVGAGSGAMLAGLRVVWPGPVVAVERSGPARHALTAAHPEVTVAAALDDVPGASSAVVVANEVLDNIPAALARRTRDGWVEIGVGEALGELVPVDLPARPDVAAWCERHVPMAGVGSVVSVQRGVSTWIRNVLDRFPRVALCVIDYAATADDLAARDPASVLRSYRRHRSGIDPFGDPGGTDLTVDVNVDALVDAAQRCGAGVEVTTQAAFLDRFGAGEIATGLREAERHAASESRTMDSLIARSDRLDLEAVMDPSSFGGFTVALIEKGTSEASPTVTSSNDGWREML